MTGSSFGRHLYESCGSLNHLRIVALVPGRSLSQERRMAGDLRFRRGDQARNGLEGRHARIADQRMHALRSCVQGGAKLGQSGDLSFGIRLLDIVVQGRFDFGQNLPLIGAAAVEFQQIGPSPAFFRR